MEDPPHQGNAWRIIPKLAERNLAENAMGRRKWWQYGGAPYNTLLNGSADGLVEDLGTANRK
jgi:hypothetical protein